MTTLDPLASGDLRIDATAASSPAVVRLAWSGKSNARQADQVLLPYLERCLAAAADLGAALELRFEALNHFNSSTIVSHDVVKSLKPPTAFERAVVNMGLAGAQKDHRVPSSMVNGIFWSDVAAFASVYKILTSRVFGLDDKGARELIQKSFCEENESLHRAQATHDLARESYVQYLADLDFVTRENKEMRTMAKSSVARTVDLNRRAYDRAMRTAVPVRGRT